jgi:hypothetical protein
MYAHFQATPVTSFDDPVALARVIANSLGRDFSEPKDPAALLLQQQKVTESPPDVFDSFSLTSVGTSGDAARSTGTVEISFNTPITLFEVSAAGWHPQVKVTVSSPELQVPGDSKGRVKLTLSWLQSEGPPETVIDSVGRRFRFERPRDPGDEWYPMYITFEADRYGIWGLVTYFKVTTHQKGFPEFSKIRGSAPFGWVRGQKSP